MAKAMDYSLGPHIFPRGWFVIAESRELDSGPRAIRFFAQDFVLYRGESGTPILLDAYCSHMGTHLAAGDSAHIARANQQIEGDSIRCPYHGWRYGPDGQCDDIPYHDRACPKSAALNAYRVQEVMGCIMMWYDPEGNPPLYEPPCLTEWDEPNWVRWQLDHLGELAVHPQEIIDNMADCQHLGPTHGAPCELFANEFQDHIYIQRQAGFHSDYQCMLRTKTWYTGPGILLSKQLFGDVLMYELIAHTPVEDGSVKVWHAVLYRSPNPQPNEQDRAFARQLQQGALDSFAADFDIWKNKRPAIHILQLPNDGPFANGRRWYKQFYDVIQNQPQYSQSINGVQNHKSLAIPGEDFSRFESTTAAMVE